MEKILFTGTRYNGFGETISETYSYNTKEEKFFCSRFVSGYWSERRNESREVTQDEFERVIREKQDEYINELVKLNEIINFLKEL